LGETRSGSPNLGIKAIAKEALTKRATDYQNWVESYARNHGIPLEWAEKRVRKEDHVRPYLKSVKRKNVFGVYFIFKSMEQGATFRSMEPKFKTADPDYRILKKTRSRFTHYYFYIFDEELGAMVLRVASFLPFQITCYLNAHHFMERELFRKGIKYRMNDNAFLSVADLFKRSCEIALACLSADKISYFFGQRITKRFQGKLNTTLAHIEQGHHVLRAYFKNAFVKQYEKFRTFLRIETCGNNLADFHLKKALDHLPEIGKTLRAVNDRFAETQTAALNVHFDFPLALPITIGNTPIPGIKIQDTRMIRLMEVLLHNGNQIHGFSTNTIHNMVINSFLWPVGKPIFVVPR